ncbi:FliA/WhiG family RNA polymerase sigma factor [soil metagenome]
MTAATEFLWQAYLENGDIDARDQLLSEHLGLVHHVARQISRSLSAHADFDELVSAGSIGLINAMGTFDPSRGLAFSTFAAPRIRGAILDELRRQDHVPRSIRRKVRDIAAAREALTRVLVRAPEHRQIAEHLGIELETLWRWDSEIQDTVQVSLDQPLPDGDGRSATPADLVAGDTDRTIEGPINHGQEMEILRRALVGLKEQERVVLSLYYFEELRLHQIATVLELTESRVSQIRSKAIAKLRVEMAPLRERVA